MCHNHIYTINNMSTLLRANLIVINHNSKKFLRELKPLGRGEPKNGSEG